MGVGRGDRLFGEEQIASGHFAEAVARGGQVPALVGVDADGYCGASRFAHGADPSYIFARIKSHFDLETGCPPFEKAFGQRYRLWYREGADDHFHRQCLGNFATQKLVNGLVHGLAGDIPERHFYRCFSEGDVAYGAVNFAA